jgi:hypothetical protein
MHLFIWIWQISLCRFRLGGRRILGAHHLNVETARSERKKTAKHLNFEACLETVFLIFWPLKVFRRHSEQHNNAMVGVGTFALYGMRLISTGRPASSSASSCAFSNESFTPARSTYLPRYVTHCVTQKTRRRFFKKRSPFLEKRSLICQDRLGTSCDLSRQARENERTRSSPR